MAAPYYTHTNGLPADQTRALPAEIRDEFDKVEQSFNLFPLPAAIQGGLLGYAVATGTVNAFALTVGSAVTAYSDGLTLRFKSLAANTGAATVNVNGLGIRPITRQDGTALAASDIYAGQISQISYDATAGAFQLALSPLAASVAAGLFAQAAGGFAGAASTAAIAAGGFATNANDSAILAGKWSTSLTLVDGTYFGARKYAIDASGSASAANTSAINAGTSATASAASAIIAGSTLNATSTTSLLLSLGPKSFTIQPDKAFVAGQRFTLARASAPGTVMYGRIDTYSTTTSAVTATVDSFAGTFGTYTDWVLGVSGSSSEFVQAGTGAVARTAQNKSRERISVKDFGAMGDGTTDDTVAVKAAIAAMEAASVSRGGRLYFPKGEYKLSDELVFTQYVAGTLHSIYLEGDGAINTVLNFSTCAAGKNGIVFGPGAHFGVRGLEIYGAKADGLKIGATGSDFCMFFKVEDVRIQACVGHGMHLINTYMGTASNVWSRDNGGSGFRFDGFHTSISFANCEASNNTAAGYSINGLVYSHFSACGADDNLQQGYTVSNVQGVKFTACGAESNTKDGWLIFTSNTSATGLPTECQDVRGLTLDGCFGFHNSKAGVAIYATFLTASTSDSRKMDFKIAGGSAVGNASGDRALVLAGTSGKITCLKELFNDSSFTTADSIAGTTDVRNLSLAGLRTVAGVSGASQTITSGTAVNLAITASPTINDLGATVTSSAIVIPAGVNKVRVSFSVAFDANVTGVRQAFLNKNGAGSLGLPATTMLAANAGSSILSGSSAPLSVVAGDTFSLSVAQFSGGNLNITAGTSCFLAVEALF